MSSLNPVATAICAGIVPAVCDAEAGEPRLRTLIAEEPRNRKLLQVSTGSVKKRLRLIGHYVATLTVQS